MNEAWNSLKPSAGELSLLPRVVPVTPVARDARRRFRPGPLHFRFNRRLSFGIAVLLLFSFFGPAEAVIRAGVGFTALRAALFITLVPAAVVFCRKVARGGYVPVM